MIKDKVMSESIKDSFLKLTRLGLNCGIIDNTEITLRDSNEWETIKVTAEQHGLSAIVLDGIEQLPIEQRPLQDFLLQWIGETLQNESIFSLQGEVARDVAKLFYRNGIKIYVLKGIVISECYPKPNHRVSVDIDCFLLPENGDFDAWAIGNDLVYNKGFLVNTDFYKNSSFDISGVTFENHQFLTPFRGNERLAALEKKLQELIRQDKGEDIINGTWLYRPPVMVTALFLIEHAYSHFLHEGLTWRHVLDWVMFGCKHKNDIDWNSLEATLEEFGFKKFYDSYNRLGKYALGELTEAELTKNDKRMLEDVWAELDLNDTTEGFKGKMNLVGNTLKAWWKYHYFAEITMIHALWIQVYGVLFDKHPKLAR